MALSHDDHGMPMPMAQPANKQNDVSRKMIKLRSWWVWIMFLDTLLV